jgi:hypothetical protein
LAVCCFGRTVADFRRGHRRALPIRDALLIGGAAHRLTLPSAMDTAIVASFNLAWKVSWLPDG